MKKEIVVLVGISLCAMLLISPALASGVDTLEIYGNANEDDTIDIRDLTYVKLIFFGKKPETELADAKYDGKINPLDFIQIKLIIVGKEKEITVVDSADRIVTVKKPIKGGVIPFSAYTAEVLRLLEEQDKIVAVDKTVKRDEVYFPELSKLPSVGSSWSPDLEVVASHKPELVIAWTTKPERIANLVEVVLDDGSVVSFMLYKPDDIVKEIVKLGYLFGKEDRVRCYVDDFHGRYMDSIKTRTEGLSGEERPKVYVENNWKADEYAAWVAGSAANSFIKVVGGKNIFADIPPSSGPVIVDPEKVVEKNPDIIIRYISSPDSGYGMDDPSKMKALRESIMNRPELANVTAVKDGTVYIIDSNIMYGPDYPIGIVYWAKWIHPELFEDLDPQAIHQQYIDIQGLDYDLDEHGVFVYHPEEHPDGK
jgi:iron complex transport system substrate-binding protein